MISTSIMDSTPSYPNDYSYPPNQVPPPPPHHSTIPPMRPTLDVYYHQQPQHSHHPGYHHAAVPVPSPHHHPAMVHTPHGYYPAPHQQQQQHHYAQHYASTPSALASSSSLKRKMSGNSVATTPVMSTPAHARTSPSAALAHDKLCDLCHHPDPILFSAKCDHLFHSRCVNVWPLDHCPVCRVDLPHVSILRIDMNEEIETRSGKWTRAEEKFIEVIIQEFDRSCFPLANGTPVRLVLAKLLNCSTMRLSKKFQKNALGKRTFRIPKPTKGTVAMEFNSEEHVMREQEFSRLETIFRHELVEQFRRENNTDEGAYVETINLRKAVKQFWVTNFLKFAVVVGQPVEGLDVSDGKKKKHALQMLRDGHFDELLVWNALASSPQSSGIRAAIATKPTRDSSLVPVASQTQPTHWSSGYPHISNQGEIDGMLPPVKKQRTPETVARLQINSDVPTSHFDLHVQQQQQQQQSMASYDYSRAMPQHGYAPQYQSNAYAQDAYAIYQPVQKHERSPQHYETVSHSPQHLHQVQPYPEPSPTHDAAQYVDRQSTSSTMSQGYRTSTSSSMSSVMTAESSYQSMGNDQTTTGGLEASASTNQASCPWDGLLEEISNEPAAPVDPSLQAWSNLNIL